MNYDEILALDPDHMGLSIEMNGHNLRRSKPIDIRGVPNETVNQDHVAVYCVKCKQWAVYYGGGTYALDGYWRCSRCERKVTEDRIYKAIEKENDEWNAKYMD